MDEEEFKAWVAEIQLSDAVSFPAIKDKVEARCRVFSKYAYELHEVIDEKSSELYPGLFFRVNGEQFQKTELELLAYNVPISKIIEENSLKNVQDVVDQEFAIHVDQTGVPGLEGGDRLGPGCYSDHCYPTQVEGLSTRKRG